MTSNPVNWHEDVALDPAKEYRALVRSLRWTEGFGVLFVQCSPAEGSDLVKRVRQDLAGKTIEVLTLNAEDTNLFDCVEALPNKDDIDVLFVQGLEQSIYAYERSRAWETPSQAYTYSEASVPRLLSHLNLNRELFYKQFKFFFVFLVPLFVLKYVSKRAPDFFDWRSGVLEFPADLETTEREYERLFLSRNHNEYRTWTQEKRNQKILEIQAWLEESRLTSDRKADFLFDQVLLFIVSKEDKDAVVSFDKALELRPDNQQAWNARGLFLNMLRREEEAIASFDKALELKPDDHETWSNRGDSLSALGRKEEAIASFDKALELKSDYNPAWKRRGNLLSDLGLKEEAIASFDKALELKPDDCEAWNRRGNLLSDLGLKEEAIYSFDKVLKFKPDDHETWSNRGSLMSDLGRYEEAIASFDQSITIKPENHEVWLKRGISLAALGRYEEAIASFDQTVAFKYEYKDLIWNMRGLFLHGLGRYEEAIASYDQALEIKPDKHEAWYGRGNSLLALGRKEEAIASYDQALAFKPD